MAPPDNSDRIRCGMCGTMNDAERALCENCGARLRPLTPEELGLAPSPKEPSQPTPPASSSDAFTRPLHPTDERPVPSSTDTLHMRFDIEDEPTMVGPSAAKANLDRDTRLNDEEPDFTIGGARQPEEDTPDWLRDESQQEQPPSDIPDWLSQEAGEKPASPLDIPDWLGESSSPAGAPPSGGEEDVPGWLRRAEEPSAQRDEEPSAPDWLSDTSQNQPTRRMPSDTPDWLSQLSEPPSEEQPSGPASDVPDWLRPADGHKDEAEEQPEAPAQPLMSTGMPDWLTQGSQETITPPAEEEKTPPAPPPPKRSGVTDWLRGLGVEPTAEEIQAALPKTPAEETTPAAETAFPESHEEIAPKRIISSIPLDETPDWLLALEAEAPEGQPETPEAAAAQLEEEPAAPPEETAQPAWLGELSTQAPAPPSETASPPEASADSPGPDWLRTPEETPEPVEFPQSDEPPPAEDWLSQIRAETPSLDIETEAPDWLRAPGEDLSAEPEAEAPSPAVPDWLSGMGAESAAPVEPMEPAETPDWLHTAGEETPAAASEAEAPSPAVPDWLSGMGAESAAPVEPMEPAEVPDWLSGMAAEPPAPSEPSEAEIPVVGTEAAIFEGLGIPGEQDEATPPEPSVEAPDWLSTIGEGAPPAPAAPAPETPAPSEVEVPDWLSTIGEGAPSAPAAPAPVGGVEAPDWLSGMGIEPPAPPTPDIMGEPSAPEWLSDLGEAPGGGPSIEQELLFPTEAAAPFDESEAPDWLNMMNLDMPGSGASAPAGGEDLLGLSEDLLSPEAQQAREEEEMDLSATDLPEWLREAAPGEQTGRSAPLTPSAELPPELAAELEGLRFEAVTGERGDESITERVGALKDVSGVIRSELLFDGASLRADDIIDQIIVTDEQARRVEAIQAMLAREAQGVVVTGQRQSTLPLVRWLVVLALTAAVAATRFVQPLSAPSAGVQPQRAYEFIQSLPPDSTVLAVFEYEPDTAAEMQPLAEAVLSHLARRGDVTVYTLSTRPTGTAMAQAALASLTDMPSEWANLGYIAGGPTGISALTIGPLPGVASPLQTDYRGKALNVGALRLSDLDPAVIIVLAARSEHLRAWVEQAGTPLGAPMIAAVSAASTPLAYPYEQSGQFEAVLSGLNDAVAYQALQNNPDNAALATWNAQAVGGAAAAALIVIGGVLYGLIAFRQQEQE